MNLDTHDVHLILSGANRTGKLFAAGGIPIFDFETRNRTVRDGQLEHWGNCPPGEFILGKPIPMNTPPFGPWFLGIYDYGSHHAMFEHHRSGIGLHGGGSGLPHPLAPVQSPPWVPTHGCWRMVNEDLGHLVTIVKAVQDAGGRCFVTVTPWVPGSVEETDDWLDVEESALDEDE